tara:strand:+ start:1891 stop:2343 length:453 start_codon:yes stop_codon:yes gene_type:complete
MKCSKCKTDLTKEDEFCPECGSKIKKKEIVNKSEKEEESEKDLGTGFYIGIIVLSILFIFLNLSTLYLLRNNLHFLLAIIFAVFLIYLYAKDYTKRLKIITWIFSINIILFLLAANLTHSLLNFFYQILSIPLSVLTICISLFYLFKYKF